jgi:hypothetical protein
MEKLCLIPIGYRVDDSFQDVVEDLKPDVLLINTHAGLNEYTALSHLWYIFSCQISREPEL